MIKQHLLTQLITIQAKLRPLKQSSTCDLPLSGEPILPSLDQGHNVVIGLQYMMYLVPALSINLGEDMVFGADPSFG